MADQNLKTLFATAERQRKAIESSWDSNTVEYQQNLAAAVQTYEDCLLLADRLSLFSPNESLEDITSGDLQYLLINYRLAELILRISSPDRKSILQRARTAYERYLTLLDQYDILSAPEKKLYNTYNESPSTFTTVSNTDPNARRAAKIANFQHEKALKQKLEHLSQNPTSLSNDDDALRTLHLATITLSTHNTFQSLESLNRELEILAMAPPTPGPSPDTNPSSGDSRSRIGGLGDKIEYSDRLDMRDTLSSTNKGPILSSSGKPLRPFTLLDNRQELRKGVFRPGHNLPTMTIDEYLEEERARGGVIEGGGEKSGEREVVDEDDYERGERETMKAREWDDYVEANPRGSGNTLNRG